jgi:integrase
MFAEKADYWRENKLVHQKVATIENMGSHLDKYLLPTFGPMAWEDITERIVQEFVTGLGKRTYTSQAGIVRPLSRGTIKNILVVFRLVLGRKHCRDWNITYPRKVFNDVVREDQRFFTVDEMRRIIAVCSGQWKVLFSLLCGTGLRASESFALHTDDIDLKSGCIHVKRNVFKGKEQEPKTRAGRRTVYIDQGLADLLRVQIHGRPPNALVFPSKTEHHLSPSNVRFVLHRILDKLAIPRGGLHAWRHGRVSALRAKQVDVEAISKQVGHSSLDMTNVYTHFEGDFLRGEANRVVGLCATCGKELAGSLEQLAGKCAICQAA